VLPEISREIMADTDHQVCQSVPPELRDDARQDAFVRILRARSRYDSRRGASFRTFCWHQESGAVMDFRRSLRGRSHFRTRLVAIEDVADIIADPAPRPDTLAAAQELSELMALLPPKWQQVLIEHYWHDRTLSEIGAAMDTTKATIWRIEHQALDRLREYATRRRL
jgi:RNA polymerase sigma factor (sigma-70 family)